MATTYTLAQLEALKAAFAQGAQSVEFEGKKVVYRSLAEMLRLIRLIEAELDVGEGEDRTRAGSYVSGL